MFLQSFSTEVNFTQWKLLFKLLSGEQVYLFRLKRSFLSINTQYRFQSFFSEIEILKDYLKAWKELQLLLENADPKWMC